MSAYNEQENISRAIESILNQTFADFEFIIIDDGSTDATNQIIDSYSQEDDRIILISKKNTGLADSLNAGIGISMGDYIARMDADDLSAKERLYIQLTFLEDNSNIALVGTWAYLIDLYRNTKKECKPPTSDRDIRKYMQKDNPFIHSSVMFRRHVIGKVGYYNLVKGMEDYDLWLRIAKDYKVANMPLFLVTRHENRNFHTRPYFKELNKYDIYSLRLKYQLQAVKNFGVFPETSWYLLRTLIKILINRFAQNN